MQHCQMSIDDATRIVRSFRPSRRSRLLVTLVGRTVAMEERSQRHLTCTSWASNQSHF